MNQACYHEYQCLTWDGLQPRFSATFMNYAGNGQTVTHVMGETWNNSGSGITDYAQTDAREVRYDAARQRYMDAPLNAGLAIIDDQTDWTDYDGDAAYATFGFDGNQLERLESWEPGVARVQQPAFPTSTAHYFHTDHLGTTRHMSRSDGSAAETGAYSAFGEQVSGVDFHFYGYAGAHGYRADYDFPFLHVGARYYDPATGRFLQRDPIGIGGGVNVYEYAQSDPVTKIDPDGQSAKHGNKGGHIPGPPGPWCPGCQRDTYYRIKPIPDEIRSKCKRVLFALACAGVAIKSTMDFMAVQVGVRMSRGRASVSSGSPPPRYHFSPPPYNPPARCNRCFAGPTDRRPGG